jgi:hypothetical protein
MSVLYTRTKDVTNLAARLSTDNLLPEPPLKEKSHLFPQLMKLLVALIRVVEDTTL